MSNSAFKSLLDKYASATLITSNPSLEASNNEREVEFWINQPNVDEIASMSVSKEFQEQWGVFVPKSNKNAAEGSIRVRQTISADQTVTYELTGKQFLPDGTKDEFPCQVDADLFKFFRYIADSGMKKDRYMIPVDVEGNQLTLEVDVPYTKEGVADWIKVDLEFPEGYGDLPSRNELKKLIPFSYEGDCVVVTPTDKANKTPEANEGYKIAQQVMVLKNCLI